MAAAWPGAVAKGRGGSSTALLSSHVPPLLHNRVLPLVSRGFLAAATDADVLWRRVQLNLLTLTADGVPRLARWLEAHAAAITCLVLYGRALPTVAAVLSQHMDALAAAVQGASRLQQLDLSRALAAPLLARLDPQRLPYLRAVAVDLAPSSSSESSSSGSSGGTSRQRRSSGGGSGLSEIEVATLHLLSLPALQDLHIQSAIEVCMCRVCGCRMGDWCSSAHTLTAGWTLPPHSPRLPTPLAHRQARLLSTHPSLPARLRRLHFADTRDLPREPLLPPVARLRCLQSLRLYQRDGFQLPGPLTALAGSLACLHAAVRYADDPLRVASDLSTLSALRALWLQHAAFEAPAALAALPKLATLGLVGGADQFVGILQAMEDAPAPLPLRALHLEAHASAVAEVPPGTWQALAAGLGRCPGLDRLELPYCRLRELPPGPWLSSLQVRGWAGLCCAMLCCAMIRPGSAHRMLACVCFLSATVHH